MSSDIQRFQSILNHLLTSSQKFTDNDFYPDPPSTIGGTYSKYSFRRASEVLDSLAVFSKEVEPTDIKQGVLKNAYLLSAFAALAERPELIHRLFITDEANNAGLYAVWLNDNGIWRPVILDDFIPCRAYHGTFFPVFSQGKGGELWVALLEKAFAKINGCYFNLEIGQCRSALRDLTGAPVDQLVDAEPEDIWNFLENAILNNQIVTTSTELGDEDDAEDPAEAVVTGHAYTILGCYAVRSSRGEERIVKIRNPWANFEWKGDWSDSSALWTEDLRRDVNYPENPESGIFFMSINDYHKYFPVTWAARVKNNNHYQSVNFTHSGSTNYNVVRVTVPADTELTISLNQKDKRFFRGTDRPDYLYSYSRVLVGKVEKEGLEYITGNSSGSERNLETTCVLTAGTYLITTEVYWNQDYHKSYNLSFYTENELQIEEVEYADLLAIQKNLIKSAVNKTENNKAVTNYGKYGDPNIQKTVDCVHGIFYFYYENGSKKKSKLAETIKFSQISNLKITAPFHVDNQFDVTVLPGSELLVLYKATLEEYSWVYSASFYLQHASREDEKTPPTSYNYVDTGVSKKILDLNSDYNTFIKNSSSNLSKVRDQSKKENPANYEEEKDEVADGKYYEQGTPGEGNYYYGKGETKTRGGNTGGRSHRVEKPAKLYPEISMQVGQSNSKKIPYTNFDKRDKVLHVTSSNPKIIYVKNAEIPTKAGETIDLRLRFQSPGTTGVYHVYVEIFADNETVAEETLKFTVNNH